MRILLVEDDPDLSRQLNTTQGDAGGRPAYFVQWQTNDGRVIIFVVDAQSGQIISRQGG